MTDTTKLHGAHPLKERLVRTLKTSQDVCRDIADAIELTITQTVKEADLKTESGAASVTELIRSAIDGAVEAGSDLSEAIRGLSIGVLRGTRERGEAGLHVLSHAARTIMCHTASIGEDLAAAARGLVRGATHGAKELGLNSDRAARNVLEVTEDLGSSIVREVREALKHGK